MLTIRDLNVSLGSTPILHQVSASFPVGVTALVGRNGAGKTTLIKTLVGAIPSASGAIEFGMHNGLPRNPTSLAWVPQELDLPGGTLVSEFIRYAAWLAGVDGDASGQAEQALLAVGLSHQSRQKLRTLSGGQKRRVMIAAALVGDPGVILLDEPTVGLDPDQRDQFHRIVRALASERVVLLSTHLMEDVLGVAEQVVVIEAGAIVGETSAGDLIAQAEMLGGRDLLTGIRHVLYPTLREDTSLGEDLLGGPASAPEANT